MRVQEGGVILPLMYKIPVNFKGELGIWDACMHVRACVCSEM